MEGTLSIVKHAAVGDPLLSAEERVNQAMARVRAGKTFTPEQERWLGLIRNHLIENLTVDRDDFRLHTRRRYLGPREPRIRRSTGYHHRAGSQCTCPLLML